MGWRSEANKKPLIWASLKISVLIACGEVINKLDWLRFNGDIPHMNFCFTSILV
jgi:hypothetical protein